MKKIFQALLSCLLVFFLISCTHQQEVSISSPLESSMRLQEPNILVVYFSATNHTQEVAKILANEISADLYEIQPEIPYTLEDLNYTNFNSRTSLEMKDLDSRPKISNSLDYIDQYDVIFLGYPI